VPIVKKD